MEAEKPGQDEYVKTNLVVGGHVWVHEPGLLRRMLGNARSRWLGRREPDFPLMGYQRLLRHLVGQVEVDFAVLEKVEQIVGHCPGVESAGMIGQGTRHVERPDDQHAMVADFLARRRERA